MSPASDSLAPAAPAPAGSPAGERLIVFAKAPVPGSVKTRLSPPLDPEAAAALYEACLRDAVEAAQRSGVPFRLRYQDDPGARAHLARIFPEAPLRAQGTGNLGERMGRALDAGFGEGAGAVVVVGSDGPRLPEGRLRLAFRRLARGHDVVFGPTDDGGYYLVGVTRTAWPAARVLFDDIPWSTGDVLSRTLERASAAGLSATLLPLWHDIDRVADLAPAASLAPPDSHLGRWLRERRQGAPATGGP